LGLWPIETGNDLDTRIGMQLKSLIENVRIYNRALLEDQIKALFKLQSSHPLSKSQ
jgi:hypothetical protein